MTITTQTDLNNLYLEAWGEKYQSPRHWDRCGKMMHFAHEAEANPSLVADNAAQAEAYETAFKAKTLELTQ